MPKVVLVVDDDERIQSALREVLSSKYVVISAYDGYEGLSVLDKKEVDVVITDLKMPKMGGLDFFKAAKKKTKAPFIFITAYGTVSIAVEAMKEGAFDFIMKPFPPEMIERVVSRAITYSAKVSGKVRVQAGDHRDERKFVWVSPKMARVMEIIDKVASTKATVLIEGESGTGKELVARLIHEKSGRTGRFVAVNCAAIPETLLESELFGYEKGAFTGATLSKKGKFELADGGTILLDEIGDMPLTLQAKLLRVLQEGEVDKLGGTEPKKIDVRIIASTNRNLEKLVDEGKFREDLYYRLRVIPIRLPPLRERPEDIVPLAEYFVEKYVKAYNLTKKLLTDEAKKSLMNYHWPGNVRELENTIERAVILSSDREEITVDDIFIEPRKERTEGMEEASISDLEKMLIVKVIRETGCVSKASAMLGIDEEVLREKIARYSIDVDN